MARIDDAQDLVLPHRLNREPVVVLGLTRTELLTISVVATAGCIPAGALFGIAIGKWSLGLPIGFAAIAVVVVVTGVVFCAHQASAARWLLPAARADLAA